MLEMVMFYVFATAAVISAVMVVTKKNPVASVFALIITFMSIAGLYAALSAHFLAIIQILVYAGAIMVLFLFVVMLLDLRKDEFFFSTQKSIKILGIAIVCVLLAEIYTISQNIHIPSASGAFAEAYSGPGGNTAAIGRLLFTTYLLPFELTSVLLMVAIIGAVLLSRRR
ncbi:MAG: NADH-quinone oxidoreductase subunit J [Candidatus Schekmanbacteria bacterium]|nr:NADH-quinone oxidoreductase subunit J [Candidatus Schekmanbacteria bacterium]